MQLADQRARRLLLLWILLCAAQYLTMIITAPEEKRTVLNIVPALCIQSAVFALVGYAAHRLDRGRWRRIALIVVSVHLFLGLTVNAVVLASGSYLENMPPVIGAWAIQFLVGVAAVVFLARAGRLRSGS